MTLQEFRNTVLAAASDAKQSGFPNTHSALLNLLAEIEHEQRAQVFTPVTRQTAAHELLSQSWFTSR